MLTAISGKVIKITNLADIFLPRFYLLWPSLGFPEKLASSKSAVAWPTEITEINLITLHPYD